MRDELLCRITGRTAQAPMEMEVARQRFYTENDSPMGSDPMEGPSLLNSKTSSSESKYEKP